MGKYLKLFDTHAEYAAYIKKFYQAKRKLLYG